MTPNFKEQSQSKEKASPSSKKVESPGQFSPVDSTSMRLKEEQALENILITSSESKVLQRAIREANEVNSQSDTPVDLMKQNVATESKSKIKIYDQQFD